MSIPTVESHTRISRFGLVNAFLVQEDDGLTLIDTAISGSAKPILAAADGPRRSDRPDRPHARPRRPHRLARRARRQAPRRGGADLRPRRHPAREGHDAATRRARQAPRRLPGRQDEADPHVRRRRADRLARCDRGPRPHPRPRRASWTAATAPSTAATPSRPSSASTPAPAPTRSSRSPTWRPGTGSWPWSRRSGCAPTSRPPSPPATARSNRRARADGRRDREVRGDRQEVRRRRG